MNRYANTIPVRLTLVVLLGLPLSSCQLNPLITYDKSASATQNKSHPAILTELTKQSKMSIDWSKVDSSAPVSINNEPRDIEYPDHIVRLAKAVHRPVADIYRHEMVYRSPEVRQIIDKIKAQLGDSYIDIYGNGEGVPKYFIVTRRNVEASSYEYVIKEGELRGFSIGIEIVPIADRSKSAMLKVYDNEEKIESIAKVIRVYGGELQSIGYTPIGFKVSADVYFNYPLTDDAYQRLKHRLQQLTGVNFEVKRTGRLIY